MERRRTAVDGNVRLGLYRDAIWSFERLLHCDGDKIYGVLDAPMLLVVVRFSVQIPYESSRQKNSPELGGYFPLYFKGLLGAENQVRTGDLNLGMVALYQLSYSRTRAEILAAKPDLSSNISQHRKFSRLHYQPRYTARRLADTRSWTISSYKRPRRETKNRWHKYENRGDRSDKP